MHDYCSCGFYDIYCCLLLYGSFSQAQSGTVEGVHDRGCLFVSTSYFERSTIVNLQSNVERENTDRDVGFWVGLHPEGEMKSIRSLLPLSVVPKFLKHDFIAMEVIMKNGKKHAIFRGLVTVVNESDMKVDISICHSSLSYDDNSSATSNGFACINPGCSIVLPWGCSIKNSEQCLRLRPVVSNQHPYKWGNAVVSRSNFASGKDQSADPVSLSRQSTMKKGNKMANFAFKLNQLEKKDLLICCFPRIGSKQVWLSAGADATVLHTELNTPVYDWRISINSPLKLENRLPCPAEFTVWERTEEGSFMERQQGVISSRRSAHIYSADIRRRVYLTLFVQGGWVLEKVTSHLVFLCNL